MRYARLMYVFPGPISTVAAEDVTGVDLSEVMIASARLKHKDAKWVTGNLFSLDTLLVSRSASQSVCLSF